ncbi:MAG: phosphoribosylglycinamide formyltransferase [Alphaproteobacteria bacterium]|nr:phosphoribosylglycinamide formyltransferase [Alphaproteobacteria bacterium]
MNRKRTAILISGRGSNMDALIAAAQSPAYPAEIVLVLSNAPGAEGLAKAAKAGIATAAIDHKGFEGRAEFEAAVQAELEAANVDLICLAGFMRLLTDAFVGAWHNRMINIHPSLLPAYKGLDTHRRVIRDGGRITGCTVHFVRPQMDQGPIIAQAAVPVHADDMDDSLAERVLTAEHAIYPMALKLVANETVRVAGEKVRFEGEESDQAALLSPAPVQ